MTSAPKRCFSWESTTRTSAGPPRWRSSRCVRSSASSLRDEVTSTLRPVYSTAIVDLLKILFALGGRRDAELLAVLRHGAPGDQDALGPQLLHDARVGVRMPPVLVLDDTGDLVLDRERGDIVARRRVDAAVEEILHREETPRRVDVFVGHDARDGRLVHADVVGDVAEHERPEVLDAVVEERPLVAHDGLGHLVDRTLPLVEALDQPDRRPHLVLE